MIQFFNPFIEFCSEFTSSFSANYPRPQQRVDSARDFFSWLFKILEADHLNPSASSLGSTARARIIATSTSVPKEDPPSLNRDKLVSYVMTSSLSSISSLPWIDLRNRCILLYCLSLGRRPSNASKAIWPSCGSYISPNSIKIQELGSKQDRSRVGCSIFLEHASNPSLCIACHLILYMNHPNSIRIHKLASSLASSSPSPPCKCHNGILLFFSSKRGTHHFTLAKATCSARISEFLVAACCKTDPSTRNPVNPRDIRSFIHSQASRYIQVKECHILHMQGWKQKNVQDVHYLRGASLVGWIDFCLGLKSSISTNMEDRFISLVEAPPSYTSPHEPTWPTLQFSPLPSIITLPTQLVNDTIQLTPLPSDT